MFQKCECYVKDVFQKCECYVKGVFQKCECYVKDMFQKCEASAGGSQDAAERGGKAYGTWLERGCTRRERTDGDGQGRSRSSDWLAEVDGLRLRHRIKSFPTSISMRGEGSSDLAYGLLADVVRCLQIFRKMTILNFNKAEQTC
eukprot:3734805-Pleurochrysis_carterae.AAC.1